MNGFEIFLYVLLLLVLALIGRSIYRRLMGKLAVYEYQRGLLFRHGKFVRQLEPGAYRFYLPAYSVQMVDMRITNVSLSGQEVLTADNVGIKVSLAAAFKVSDPYLAINNVLDYKQSLYLYLQLNLRDIIGGLEVEDLLSKRAEIGKQLMDLSKPQAEALGVDLLVVNIKDMMFPGELKNIFAQVVNARKEGLAALERARGESAALRNLANGAKVLENNPHLMQLRMLQVLEKSSGNTVVFSSGEASLLETLTAKRAGK